MGNAQDLAQSCLNEPMTEADICNAVCSWNVPRVQAIIDNLLKGSMPTNFGYQDILSLLLPFTDDHFICLPIWTLQLKDVRSSAKCMVAHWPMLTDDQLQDPSFLSSIRVMLPLFKNGSPIGHARFMFFDNWEPLPASTVRDEEAQWMTAITEFIPVQGIPEIIMEYQVLERYNPSTPHSCKVIDSIPAPDCVFQADVDAFSRVIELIMGEDEEWCASFEHKSDMKERLCGLRTFLTHVTAAACGKATGTTEWSIEGVLLPSTTQIGVECIIITLCRVISTWIKPYEIPLEECRPLCVDKKGRRVIAELLLRAKGWLRDDGHVPDGGHVHSVVSEDGSAMVGKTETGLPSEAKESDEVTRRLAVEPEQEPDTSTKWYNVYDRPTMSIYAPTSEYKPRGLKFSGVLGYTVYLGCKWVNRPRQQEFLPNESVLCIGGQTGCLYICPVYAHVSSLWYFLVLGHPGYSLFRANGRKGKVRDGMKASQQHFQVAPHNHGWTPPPTSEQELEAFISGWSDPTFKQHRYQQHDTSEEPTSVDDQIDITEPKTGKTWVRRSKRNRRVRQIPEPVTPVRRRVRMYCIIGDDVYVMHCVDYVGEIQEVQAIVCGEDGAPSAVKVYIEICISITNIKV